MRDTMNNTFKPGQVLKSAKGTTYLYLQACALNGSQVTVYVVANPKRISPTVCNPAEGFIVVSGVEVAGRIMRPKGIALDNFVINS